MSTEVAAVYNPQGIEQKWYRFWLDHHLFASHPNEKPPYTIIIPPPNVTGVLHMGHMLNNTIQDILVRRARMQGYNACWVPGTDHASIATEAKVVDKLAQAGIEKKSLTRAQFLEHAWDWTHTHGGIILEQLKRLGASCDWDRTAFTMDEQRSQSVIDVFCDLYNKGLIYRGVRVVNWDPAAGTALSDEEVIHKEQHGKLYYLRYQIEGSSEFITVATTRPETIMGDTAVCVHPDDPRYKHLRDKKAIVPLVNRAVPIITDDYIDVEFGTGCLKVTPAHDVNDYNLGIKHQLDSIDIFNDDGTLNEHGGRYCGMDRFAVRKQIAKDLAEAGLMEKEEDYTNKVGYSERTGVAIEPKLSMQWFLKMEQLAKPALQAVLDGDVQLVPDRFLNTYKHWLENIKDWCISRQLWWGHRIPAYYLPSGEVVVAPTAEEALRLAQQRPNGATLTAQDLKQEEDALDTWFSSWLWPLSLFGNPTQTPTDEAQYYYPTSVLVTGPDILFFWVARMIIAGYEYRQAPPFHHVYLTGIVRDDKGRKMSKSLGNSPDPIELMDRYGADAVRMGLMMAAPAGNDLLYDESLVEQGRNFCNKLWNSFRLLTMMERSEQAPQEAAAQLAIEWMSARIAQAVEELNDLFDKYRLSEATTLLYKLVRDDFSAFFLEAIKPPYGEPMNSHVHQKAMEFLNYLLRLLHPFMPFITEELWQALEQRSEGESIMYATHKHNFASNTQLLQHVQTAQEIITHTRNIRNAHQLSSKEALTLYTGHAHPSEVNALIAKLANVTQIIAEPERCPANIPQENFIVGVSAYTIPMDKHIDTEALKKRLMADLQHQEKFLASVEKKLSNEKFRTHAKPQVVALEEKKKKDATKRITELKEKIKQLS